MARNPEAPPKGRRMRSVGDRIGAAATLSQLTDREKALAMRAKAQKKLAFAVKLLVYERTIALAERFDEDLAIVERACYLYGLAHYEQWAADGTSPFTPGVWRPELLPAVVDGVPTRPPYQPPAQDALSDVPLRRNDAPRRVIAADRPPAAMQYVEEHDETAYAETVQIPEIPAGLLPGGFTDNSRSEDAPTPPRRRAAALALDGTPEVPLTEQLDPIRELIGTEEEAKAAHPSTPTITFGDPELGAAGEAVVIDHTRQEPISPEETPPAPQREKPKRRRRPARASEPEPVAADEDDEDPEDFL